MNDTSAEQYLDWVDSEIEQENSLLHAFPKVEPSSKKEILITEKSPNLQEELYDDRLPSCRKQARVLFQGDKSGAKGQTFPLSPTNFSDKPCKAEWSSTEDCFKCHQKSTYGSQSSIIEEFEAPIATSLNPRSPLISSQSTSNKSFPILNASVCGCKLAPRNNSMNTPDRHKKIQEDKEGQRATESTEAPVSPSHIAWLSSDRSADIPEGEVESFHQSCPKGLKFRGLTGSQSTSTNNSINRTASVSSIGQPSDLEDPLERRPNPQGEDIAFPGEFSDPTSLVSSMICKYIGSAVKPQAELLPAFKPGGQERPNTMQIQPSFIASPKATNLEFSFSSPTPGRLY